MVKMKTPAVCTAAKHRVPYVGHQTMETSEFPSI